MQITPRIDALEERARGINLTLAELCREAGEHFSTIQRWRSGECDPKLGTVERVLGSLEAHLVSREAAVSRHLQEIGAVARHVA